MKVCPRCKALFGEAGTICFSCELKLELFLPANDVDTDTPTEKGLKATIPEGVTAFLDLKAGDKIEWKMDTENGISFCKVRRKELTHD